jgi:UTP--glucose-1-phosphate uridylyltransferase
MITKAVIPAAGFGSRFLPVTKTQPKEMLPVVDTPAIQMVVEEAVASGIHDILIITSIGKRAIEDHFDRSFELENQLRRRGQKEQLKEIKRISNMGRIFITRQKQIRGLGDAVLCAEKFVSGEPFALLLGDTVIDSPVPCLSQLKLVFNRFGGTVIGVEEVPREKVGQYGLVKGDEIEKDLYLVDDLIEKPDPKRAPSNLAIGGRYILDPAIFKCIRRTKPGVGGEIQLTDAFRLLNGESRIHALKIDGVRYDIGSKFDFIMTNIDFALKREQFRGRLLDYMRRKVAEADAETGTRKP